MNRIRISPNNHFWLITWSIVFGLTLPVLIQDAMFQDAVLYSCVAHNLSIGFGTFWFPQYSALNLEGIASFHEQPPLVFGVQALFYKVLGHGIYVERIYTLLMIIFNALLINVLWKEVYRVKPEYRNYGWLPVFFWIIIPICFWSFRNNLIENTMSVFTLLSVWLSYRLVKSEKNNYLLWGGSGGFIFLATFSKGVPGFFPITFPFIYYLITKRISLKKSLVYTSILLLIPLLVYSILLLFPESRQSLSIYFFERLVRRVHSMPTAAYRLEIAWRLFTELLPVLLISGLVLFVSYRKKKELNLHEHMQAFLLFLFIGISGSLPLMLTMVQKGWYLVPSFPFFALAFSILIIPFISGSLNRMKGIGIRYVLLSLISLMLFASVGICVVLQKDTIYREENTLTDVHQIGRVVPRFSTLSVPLHMYDQYNFILQGFLIRHYNISISPYDQYEYYLKEKEDTVGISPAYKKVDIKLRKYDLYLKL